MDDGIPAVVVASDTFFVKNPINTLQTIKLNADLDSYYIQLTKKTGMTRKKLSEMVHEKIDEFSGLVSEETALLMIAQDLGIKLESNNQDI